MSNEIDCQGFNLELCLYSSINCKKNIFIIISEFVKPVLEDNDSRCMVFLGPYNESKFSSRKLLSNHPQHDLILKL